MSKIYEKKEAAARYDFARALPDETSTLWMERLCELVPKESVTRILDLGGGTGRFAGSLQKTYQCPVITMDPSEAMLEQGIKSGLNNISWLCGVAEDIPLDDGTVDLVWMSNVFHHLDDPEAAFQEVYRVLSPAGYLAVRNGTEEEDAEIDLNRFFPEARQFDKGRIPAKADITSTVCHHGFVIKDIQTVYQLFASSYAEYYDKISQRGLSSLISISDKAFNTGLLKLHKFISTRPSNQPVYEPIDMMVFHKRL